LFSLILEKQVLELLIILMILNNLIKLKEHEKNSFKYNSHF
jgi:hypothetical protein